MSDIQTTVSESQKQIQPKAPKVSELIEKSKSILIGTTDAEGNPNASYAPFARNDNKLYILVSFMSRHTRNLRDMKKASVMFIEDESETKQIYARTRLTVDVTASPVEKGTSLWKLGIEKLKEAHGKILDVLTGMDDFILIELTPLKGSYINGFGSAYFVDANLEITEHRNDVAHIVGSSKN